MKKPLLRHVMGSYSMIFIPTGVSLLTVRREMVTGMKYPSFLNNLDLKQFSVMGRSRMAFQTYLSLSWSVSGLSKVSRQYFFAIISKQAKRLFLAALRGIPKSCRKSKDLQRALPLDLILPSIEQVWQLFLRYMSRQLMEGRQRIKQQIPNLFFLISSYLQYSNSFSMISFTAVSSSLVNKETQNSAITSLMYFSRADQLVTLHSLYLSLMVRGTLAAGALLILLKIALIRSTVSSSKLKYSAIVGWESSIFKQMDLQEQAGEMAVRKRLWRMWLKNTMHSCPKNLIWKGGSRPQECGCSATLPVSPTLRKGLMQYWMNYSSTRSQLMHQQGNLSSLLIWHSIFSNFSYGMTSFEDCRLLVLSICRFPTRWLCYFSSLNLISHLLTLMVSSAITIGGRDQESDYYSEAQEGTQ